ncbi:MAG TPA: hypothetical protein PKI20_13530 [Verrucomicrobiota bacterium]|nr:hypothetical protein [Verrucomicrobiota bacterium]HQL78706.1 hypothetical protein [Verrucomicrobiota bacterium]
MGTTDHGPLTTDHGLRGQVSGLQSQPSNFSASVSAVGEAADCAWFKRLLEDGYSGRMAAKMVGKSSGWWSGPDSTYQRWVRGGAAELARARREPVAAGDLTCQIEALGWFIPAATYFYMQTNRTLERGSIAEAIRRVISLPYTPVGWSRKDLERFLGVLRMDEAPVCPEGLREAILARQAAGLPLVPGRVARQVKVNPAVVRFGRNPTDAALDMVNAAGCSRFARVNGEYVPLRAGQRLQPDDGSINFCVWVLWQFPSDKCSARWGVMVGRFQLLLLVDAMSLAIRARSFIVRPRSSYRQEDALGLYNVFMRQHGIPEEIFHEGGAWNAGRVKDCLDLLKVRRHLVHSPHNKAAVEGRFNKLWTVLSGLSGGQIGRYRGEMERENAVLTSCQAGHTDPRTVFPSLETALAAIDQAILEANATPVQTHVGRWVPSDLWEQHVGETPLRKLDPATEWMFAPYCVERKVNNGINTKVRLFDSFSIPFTFAAPWMAHFHGARVRAYFDPWLPKCHATVVLAAPFEHHAAGVILGTASQTNDIAEYARLMLGLGFGPSDEGRVMRQRQLAALRADKRAITGSGRGLSIVEQRDGLAQRRTISEAGQPISSVLSIADIPVRDSQSAEPDRGDNNSLLAGRAPACRPASEDPALQEFLDSET